MNHSVPRVRSRRLLVALAAAYSMFIGGCATEGTYGGGAYFGDAYFSYDDPWYYGGCCVDPPGDIGPPDPRPEHPIVKPPPARPENPIASPSPRPTPMPRPAAMPRGGGGRGRR
jgi:hypothetical protein